MTNLASNFSVYDVSTLNEALDRDIRQNGRGETCIGILTPSLMSVASAAKGAEGKINSMNCRRMPLYCVAKILTGLLALIASDEGRLTFGQPICESEHEFEPLGVPELTIRQLLSHTHGLDAAHIGRPALTPAGHIDLGLLITSLLQMPPLFAPGTLYSHSSGGSWLVAALLERIYRLSFAEILQSKIFRPSGIDIPFKNPGHWCPATGDHLQMSVVDLMSLCSWVLQQDSICSSPEWSAPTEPPGWCFERGACAGWKDYRGGWYGHHTAGTDGYSLIVRVHFAQKVAVVVAVDGGPEGEAGMTMLRLFGNLSPELLAFRVPRKLGPNAARTLDPTAYVGNYAAGASVFRVSQGSSGSLQLDAFESREAFFDNKPKSCCELKPGTDESWFAGTLPVQFVSPGRTGFRHIWNGRELLRRIEI